jgi:hypothetical protein
MNRLLLAAVLAIGIPGWSAGLVLKNVHAQVYFSPNGRAQAAVVTTIGAAKKPILVKACR